MSRIQSLILLAAAAASLSSAFAAPAHPAKKHTGVQKAPKPMAAAPATFGVKLVLDKPIYVVPAQQNSIPHIHATLTLFNHTPIPMHLLIGGQLYDWQILDTQGQVLWDYATGKAFPHYLRQMTLQNSVLSYTDDVPLQNQDGTPLAPGSYTLRGSFPHTQNVSATVGFTVTR